MQHLAVRRVNRLAALAQGGGFIILWAIWFATGCGSDGPLRRFLTHPEERRELLLDSLWYRDNAYARLRWERYASGGDRDWTRLPVFHPETAPLRPEGPPQGFHALDLTLPDRSEEDPGEVALRSALLRIGESAFFQYPAQLVSGFDRVRASPERARSYGLWIGATPDGETRLGGLLEVQLPSGDRALATSCATCHAASSASDPGGPVIAGAANADLDIGKLASDFSSEPDPKEARWGPGRLDTSPDGVDNPAAIPELRAVAAQRYLHHDATLRNSLFALALRIETLLITSFKEGAAPPIEVPLGLALYLWQLPPGELPSASAPDASPGAREAGATIFKENCARCHATPEHAGEPVPISEVQTDGALGKSPERGTGSYRVPTLRRVGLRRQLFHDGSLPDLRALLDPRRLQDDYAGGRRAPGPIPGHPYGLDLSEPERDALRTFLQSL